MVKIILEHLFKPFCGRIIYMRSINYKLMGERIRRQRVLLGLTREQLAEKLEVSTKFCSDIELGVEGMSLSTLVKMSDILCMNINYILLGEQEDKAELDTLISLYRRCPSKHKMNFITIIRAFTDSVSDK